MWCVTCDLQVGRQDHMSYRYYHHHHEYPHCCWRWQWWKLCFRPLEANSVRGTACFQTGPSHTMSTRASGRWRKEKWEESNVKRRASQMLFWEKPPTTRLYSNWRTTPCSMRSGQNIEYNQTRESLIPIITYVFINDQPPCITYHQSYFFLVDSTNWLKFCRLLSKTLPTRVDTWVDLPGLYNLCSQLWWLFDETLYTSLRWLDGCFTP